MGTSIRLSRLLLSRNLPVTLLKRDLSGLNVPRRNFRKYLWFLSGGLTAIVCASFYKNRYLPVQALKVKKENPEDRAAMLTARERRFIKFASVEFDGQLYMTPQDFLDSVVEQDPRPRLKRRALTLPEVQQLKDSTPPLRKGSKTLFRSLRDRGIISYTEYLFLLSVLTKPMSGFRIAFNMFDTDGNQRVDKNEFLVILKILGATFKGYMIDENTRRVLLTLVSTNEQARYLKSIKVKPDEESSAMERIFSGTWREKLTKHRKHINSADLDDSDLVNDDEGLQRKHSVDTTLQTHFFGKKGKDDLYYDGFYKFMDNLQTEVLELEFSEFSKGNMAITEVDFAKILLRYTYLNSDEYDKFLERLMDGTEKGITFTEFRDFCRFLNNLEDFAIAMRMYTLADRAISKEEFSRAVKICTGFSLTRHIIDTVFAIFDQDGDGMLSYKEFIAIMKDRLHRGFRSTAKSEGWDAFKSCVKHEMKHSQNQ